MDAIHRNTPHVTKPRYAFRHSHNHLIEWYNNAVFTVIGYQSPTSDASFPSGKNSAFTPNFAGNYNTYSQRS
jgi:hypothetical protein